MDFRNRAIARPLVIAVTVAGFAVLPSVAAASASETGTANRSDNAAQAHADHQPAGNGQGRKVG